MRNQPAPTAPISLEDKLLADIALLQKHTQDIEEMQRIALQRMQLVMENYQLQKAQQQWQRQRSLKVVAIST